MRYITLLSFLLLPAVATATMPRQHHYETSAIEKNWPSAMAVTQRQHAAMVEAAAKKDLTEVHRLSYDMEAAVKIMEAQLTELKEQVEQIHLASEKNQPQKVTDGIAMSGQILQSMRVR